MANIQIRNKKNRGRTTKGGESSRAIGRTRDLTRIIDILNNYPDIRFIRTELVTNFRINRENLSDCLLFLKNHKIITEDLYGKKKWRGSSCKYYQINKKYLEFLKQR